MTRSVKSLILIIAAGGVMFGSTPRFTPIEGFELEKYLGKWYEIARFPHRFEKDLVNVTATYELAKPGKVRVINEGYKFSPEGKHSIAKGWAKFAGDPSVGHLRVSFFRPFYGDYIIVSLDDNYQHALILSSSLNYMWILARNSQIDESVYDSLVKKAASLGLDTTKLIKVMQDWKN